MIARRLAAIAQTEPDHRLRSQRDEIARTFRLTQTRPDEPVARHAADVKIGTTDTDGMIPQRLDQLDSADRPPTQRDRPPTTGRLTHARPDELVARYADVVVLRPRALRQAVAETRSA